MSRDLSQAHHCREADPGSQRFEIAMVNVDVSLAWHSTNQAGWDKNANKQANKQTTWGEAAPGPEAAKKRHRLHFRTIDKVGRDLYTWT